MVAAGGVWTGVSVLSCCSKFGSSFGPAAQDMNYINVNESLYQCHLECGLSSLTRRAEAGSDQTRDRRGPMLAPAQGQTVAQTPGCRHLATLPPLPPLTSCPLQPRPDPVSILPGPWPRSQPPDLQCCQTVHTINTGLHVLSQ